MGAGRRDRGNHVGMSSPPFAVEPSPRGGYVVRMSGLDAPVSRHDTEEEALSRARAYARGIERAGEEVTLRDGSRVVIRPVKPEDKPLFVTGFQHFGQESRYRRFMAYKKTLTPADLVFYTELDRTEHDAIGALDPKTGAGVGVARYLRSVHDPETAEVAVAVIDEWQARGVGGALLRRLAARAAACGIRRFCAAMFSENRAMLALLRDLGDVRVDREDSTIVATVDLSR
jgi:GNAT superfamily N-acetyltransferase